jgi:hypothetical protein
VANVSDWPAAQVESLRRVLKGETLDWLLPRQARVEQGLAKRHLHDGGLVLYDLTSTYFEGRRTDSEAGLRWRSAAIAVRRARLGGDSAPGLSR